MTKFNMRIEEELKEAAERAAEADKRTLTSLVAKLLTEHCVQVGTLKRGKP